MRANLRLLFFLFFFWCFFLPRVVAVVLLQQFGSVSKVGAGRKGLSSIGLSLWFHRVLLFGISLYCSVLFCFVFFFSDLRINVVCFGAGTSLIGTPASKTA
jgi:hypothetical protein